MESADRLGEALDWFEGAIETLRRQARSLQDADRERALAAARWREVAEELGRREQRVAAAEAGVAAREREVGLREERLREAGAAHAELTGRLESRTGAFERQALELEASLERLRAQERVVAERSAELDRRALVVSERAAQLDERAAAVDAVARDLERFAERARVRAAELDARELEVAAAKQRVAEQEVAAEHAAWVLRPVAVGERSGAWTLDALRGLAAASPSRADELLAYVRYLRDFADVDGRLPSAFDALIDDVFRPAPTTRSARRAGDGA